MFSNKRFIHQLFTGYKLVINMGSGKVMLEIVKNSEDWKPSAGA
jgi:hypothetical protein